MIYQLYRTFLFILIVAVFIFISLSISIFTFDKKKKRILLSKNTSITAKFLLYVLGIKIETNSIISTKGNLFVCNHISYIDIVVIAACFPTLFITSVEVQKKIFLGTLAKFGGSIFVERRKKSKVLIDIDKISEILKEGHNIVLFPEGTSSKGDFVLPFKGALFMAAINQNIDIIPICCQYESYNDVAYYGDHLFFKHLIKFFSVSTLKAKLTFLPTILTKDRNRDFIVLEAFNKISTKFKEDF